MGITRNKDNSEKRVLVYLPTGRDAALVCSMLVNVGIYAETCVSLQELEEKIAEGVGAILVAEEALKKGTLEYLTNLFNQLPVWSDLPIVLFASSGQNAERLLELVGTRFNATIVERPIRVTMLISAVRGALRAREKQYQARDLLNQLEESDRQKDLFLATLSHELRTPLNSILGWIQLLRKGSYSNLNPDHAFEVIERNAKAQAEMISEILLISRVITGKFKLNLESVELIPIVLSAIDTMMPSINAKEIQLHTSFDSDNNLIEGDTDRLRQVLLNILTNAVKFTPNNGQINVSVVNKDSMIEIEISDSGEGINSEFLPFVFERFRQADSSYTRKVGGLGLGLAIVQHLIELHGGTVSAKSEGENCGAAFTIKLPTITSQKLNSDSEDNQQHNFQQIEKDELLKNIRVLMVEDDKDSREMLEMTLKLYGMNVTTVSSAAEAMQEIIQNRPQLLISDIGMPNEDGYELIRKVRQLSSEQGKNIPAIALTGYVSLQDRKHALDKGYDEHLSKPIDIDGLIILLKHLVVKNNLNKHNNS